MKNLEMKFKSEENPTGLSINEASQIRAIAENKTLDIETMLETLRDFGFKHKTLFGRGGSHIWGKRILGVDKVSNDRIIFVEF